MTRTVPRMGGQHRLGRTEYRVRELWNLYGGGEPFPRGRHKHRPDDERPQRWWSRRPAVPVETDAERTDVLPAVALPGAALAAEVRRLGGQPVEAYDIVPVPCPWCIAVDAVSCCRVVGDPDNPLPDHEQHACWSCLPVAIDEAAFRRPYESDADLLVEVPA
ncbi:hypothetical protein [Amycolatopsis suaedae]|uniref:Uncharacterized protein n=1 Tax=Amycolatopsis suaedae TaxID=2510978 RepID=A0A4Q7IZE5_9PSEU|nr:hypothetical protein [Amycolatopsis suaedae]RZQ59808.1 hypothetical protein EWH70_32350 [Amycolatopsis suaedae]